MDVNLQMVRGVFRDVLDGRMSRESADRWAYRLIQESEAGSLTCSPLDARDRIWEGVMYLYGVDIMASPGRYLHTDDDIRRVLTDQLGDSAGEGG